MALIFIFIEKRSLGMVLNVTSMYAGSQYSYEQNAKKKKKKKIP